eukprot:m.66009 g.66009  ORF g.66009 m.66009 type:complete len:238 (-) comp13705_c0_seq3:1012-1725(-)
MNRLQLQQFAVCYLVYATNYFARKPLSVVRGDLVRNEVLDVQTISIVETGFLLAYAVGQFCVGAALVKIGRRRYAALSMIVAGTSCALFAVNAAQRDGSTVLTVALWSLNGLGCAGLFPLLSGAMAPFWPAAQFGSVLGLWTTCQQLGGVLGGALPAALLSVPVATSAWWAIATGWTGAFVLPGIICALAGGGQLERSHFSPLGWGGRLGKMDGGAGYRKLILNQGQLDVAFPVLNG